MYSIGSRNSSSVGVNVGASISPCGLFLGGGSRVKGFLRSTVFMSRGAARRALYGIVGGAKLGIAPFGRFIGADFMGAELWIGFPPVEGGATIVGKEGRRRLMCGGARLLRCKTCFILPDAPRYERRYQDEGRAAVVCSARPWWSERLGEAQHRRCGQPVLHRIK